MFVHIFAFRWKDIATDQDRVRAKAEILDFNGRIPGLQAIRVGENISVKSADYGLTGVTMFNDRNAYDAYQSHSLHVHLLRWLAPLIDAMEFDFIDP